jgi:hypothetical protein
MGDGSRSRLPLTSTSAAETSTDAGRGRWARVPTFTSKCISIGHIVDGRRVAASLKEASPATPVILLTGWGQRLTEENEVPMHVNGVLNKPPKLRQLRAAHAELMMDAPSHH